MSVLKTAVLRQIAYAGSVRSVNTWITYGAVFNYYRVRLERFGVKSVEAYEKIIHAEERRRNRELRTRQDEARKIASKISLQ